MLARFDPDFTRATAIHSKPLSYAFGRTVKGGGQPPRLSRRPALPGSIRTHGHRRACAPCPPPTRNHSAAGGRVLGPLRVPRTGQGRGRRGGIAVQRFLGDILALKPAGWPLQSRKQSARATFQVVRFPRSYPGSGLLSLLARSLFYGAQVVTGGHFSASGAVVTPRQNTSGSESHAPRPRRDTRPSAATQTRGSRDLPSARSRCHTQSRHAHRHTVTPFSHTRPRGAGLPTSFGATVRPPPPPYPTMRSVFTTGGQDPRSNPNGSPAARTTPQGDAQRKRRRHGRTQVKGRGA
jgi:hypothetical protein